MSYLNGCFLLFSFLFFDLLVSLVGSKQVLVSLNFLIGWLRFSYLNGCFMLLSFLFFDLLGCCWLVFSFAFLDVSFKDRVSCSFSFARWFLGCPL